MKRALPIALLIVLGACRDDDDGQRERRTTAANAVPDDRRHAGHQGGRWTDLRVRARRDRPRSRTCSPSRSRTVRAGRPSARRPDGSPGDRPHPPPRASTRTSASASRTARLWPSCLRTTSRSRRIRPPTRRPRSAALPRRPRPSATAMRLRPMPRIRTGRSCPSASTICRPGPASIPLTGELSGTPGRQRRRYVRRRS